MLPLLLKQNELDSIHILASAIYDLDSSVDYINEHILNGKTTIKQNITILNDTFSYLGYSDLKLTIANGKVSLNNFSHKAHSNLLLFVAEYFVLDSPTYKSTLVLLHEKKAHKETLLNQVHISESYLSKIMKEINDYLVPANVSIISRKKEYIFDGPLENWIYVDFFTRIFFSILSSPFLVSEEFNNQASYAKAIDLSDDAEKHHLLLKSLNSFPEATESYIKDPEAFDVLQTITACHDYSQTFDEEVTFSPSKKELYTLYIRLSSSTIDTSEQRQTICQTLIAEHQQSNSLIQDTVTLVDNIFEAIYVDRAPFTHEYFELMYSLLFKQLHYRVCRNNLSQLFDLAPSFAPKSAPLNDDITKKIQHFYSSKINSLPLSQATFKTITLFKESLSNELYTMIASSNETAIKVYIKMDYTPSQDFYIKKLIGETFSKDSLIFTSHISQADLIISDHHLNLQYQAPLFYLIDSNSENTLQALFSFIFKGIIDKKQATILGSL